MVTTRTDLTHNRHKGRDRAIRLIVIHTMEAPEAGSTAESIAAYFGRNVPASSHWCVDNNSRVRVVEDRDTAWTAPGANADGLQLELAGYAKQNKDQWFDAYSVAMLEIAALCCAEWVKKHNIPIRQLTNAELKAGKKGFVGHIQTSQVYKKSSHWDPGHSFPWAYFLKRVAAFAGEKTSSPHAVPRKVEYNADGSIKVETDGIRGMHTISRWQEVMGTHIDGRIDPQSPLIKADQRMLNENIAPEHMTNLTGYPKLSEDGQEGYRTIIARQWWMRHTLPEEEQKKLLGNLLAFDGIPGSQTNKAHQHALNQAKTGSKIY